MMPSCAETVFSKRSLKPIAIVSFQKKKQVSLKSKNVYLGLSPCPGFQSPPGLLLFLARDPETKPSFATGILGGVTQRISRFTGSPFAKTPPLLPTSCWVRSQPGVTGLLAVSHGDGWNKNRWWMVFFVSKWDGFTISRNIRKMTCCEN